MVGGAGFKVEFLRFDKGKPVYAVIVEPEHEMEVVKWLFNRAREALSEALKILGYSPEEVNRQPLERLTPEKKEKRRNVQKLASNLFGRYIVVSESEKSAWYKLGLSMADADKELLRYFGTTRSETAFCIIRAFRKVEVTLGSGWYTRDGAIVPALFISANDGKLARLRRLSAKEVAELLLKDRGRLAQFTAGAVDGDGDVEENGTVRISTSPSSPLARILSILARHTSEISQGKYRKRDNTVVFYVHCSLWEEVAMHMEHPERRKRLVELLKRRRKGVKKKEGATLWCYLNKKCVELCGSYDALRYLGLEPKWYKRGRYWRAFTANRDILLKALELVDDDSREVILQFLNRPSPNPSSKSL